jgi:hypothetical protein
MSKHDWLDAIEDSDSGDKEQGGKNGHWSVDKRIPLAMIFTLATFLAGWSGTFIWWMSATSQRLDVMEKAIALLSNMAAPVTQLASRVDNLERVANDTTKAIQPLDSRMTKVETTLGFIQGGVERIERSITQAVTFGSSSPPQAPRVTAVQPRLPPPVHTIPIPVSAPPHQ